MLKILCFRSLNILNKGFFSRGKKCSTARFIMQHHLRNQYKLTRYEIVIVVTVLIYA